MIDAARFWSRIDRSGGADACWPWTRGRFPAGYGAFAVNSKNRGAHRIAWELTNGGIPLGLHVLHRCDNPPCCNPWHLFLGTPVDNVADMVAKGRNAKGDNNGARLHPERMPRGDNHPMRRMPWIVKRGDDHHTRRRPELVVRGDAHYLRQQPELVNGERNPSAKLTSDQVLEIRRRHAAGLGSYTTLAAAFGVSRSAIMMIVTRRKWKHLEDTGT